MPRVENIKRHADQQQYESGDDEPVLFRVQTKVEYRASWRRRSWTGGINNVCRLDLNGRDEPVAAPRNGFDKSGIAGIIPKSFSNLEYRHSQAFVEFDKSILWPKSISNLFPRNNLSGAFHQ